MNKFNFRRNAPRFFISALGLVAIMMIGGNGGVAHAQYYGTSTTSTMIMSAATISPSILPDGMVGSNYSQVFTANVSTTPNNSFVWTVSGGTLPSGLALSSGTNSYGENAMISGIPTTAGQGLTFSISASNSGVTSTQTYVINIDPNINEITSMVEPSSTVVPPPYAVPTTTAAMGSTSADLQAELNALTTALMELESEAGMTTSPAVGSASPTMGTGAGTTVSCGSATFCRDLTVGDDGADVMALQQFLNQNGYPIAPSGPGSSGNETQHFGALTQAALENWQSANNISPAQGYFGPTTRSAIIAAMSSSNSSSSSSNGTSAPMIPYPTSTP